MGYARAQLTHNMIREWSEMTLSSRYIGHRYIRLCEGLGSAIKPSHLSGGHILKAVGRSNRLTARLTRGLTSHAPIGSYRERFHHLPSHCMCGHFFEDAFHVIHSCSLWSRSDRPRARYLLANFVKFLVQNPRAFEFSGANLDSAERGKEPGKGGG